MFVIASIALLLAGIGALCGWQHSQRRYRGMLQENAVLRDQLGMDPLTGLMNRSAFHALLDRPALREHELLVVFFFDLDRFKDVNDTLGHAVGDDLLRQVADRVVSVLPSTIALARLGGDEFACIIAADVDKPAEEYGRAIAESIAEPFLLQQQCVNIGASIGIAVGDPTRLAPHELLRRADLAMYAAKSTQDSSVRLFDDALDRREMRDSVVRVELGKAVIENLFSLHYQPLVEARTGAFSSAEALLRSQSSSLRDISPAVLVATAESSGQIDALTDWTIGTALEAAARLETHSIAVNISPVYFKRADFFSRLMDHMVRARVRPERLSIEITESVLIENLETARRSIDRVREIGTKVFLDDFGTGYSSLSYLQHFELDVLKLDKSFLRSAGDRRKANQIIRSMIDFAHSLDMRVVVEGVESDWQARLLQLVGCDLLQGYEIGMPMPLDKLIAFRDAKAEALAPDLGAATGQTRIG